MSQDPVHKEPRVQKLLRYHFWCMLICVFIWAFCIFVYVFTFTSNCKYTTSPKYFLYKLHEYDFYYVICNDCALTIPFVDHLVHSWVPQQRVATAYTSVGLMLSNKILHLLSAEICKRSNLNSARFCTFQVQKSAYHANSVYLLSVGILSLYSLLQVSLYSFVVSKLALHGTVSFFFSFFWGKHWKQKLQEGKQKGKLQHYFILFFFPKFFEKQLKKLKRTLFYSFFLKFTLKSNLENWGVESVLILLLRWWRGGNNWCGREGERSIRVRVRVRARASKFWW